MAGVLFGFVLPLCWPLRVLVFHRLVLLCFGVQVSCSSKRMFQRQHARYFVMEGDFSNDGTMNAIYIEMHCCL